MSSEEPVDASLFLTRIGHEHHALIENSIIGLPPPERSLACLANAGPLGPNSAPRSRGGCTMSRLGDIAVRVAGATPGPWTTYLNNYVVPLGEATAYIDENPARTFSADIYGLNRPKDVAFIAAAREDVPFLLAEVERLRTGLEDMTRQFAYWSEGAGGYWTGGLSALEEAFELLGWDDPQPAPEARCDEPGCLKTDTCGWPSRPGGTGPNGGYRRTCYEHMVSGQALRSL